MKFKDKYFYIPVIRHKMTDGNYRIVWLTDIDRFVKFYIVFLLEKKTTTTAFSEINIF